MATNWTNANGGDWNTAGNWDNGVPSPTNQALINSDLLSANGKSITFSALAQCMGLTITGTKTFSISSAVYGIEFYGNYVGSTVCTWALTGTAYSYAKGSMTITTNGQVLIWNRWYIDGVGMTIIHTDNFTATNDRIYIKNGIWNTNNNNIIARNLAYDTGTSTIILGSSILTIDFSSAPGINNLTLNAGTSTFRHTLNFSGLGKIWHNIENLGSIETNSGYDNFTCNNLTVTGSNNNTSGLRLSGTVTVNNNLTINGYNNSSKKFYLLSDTIGTKRTITFDPAKASISNCDFQDINCPNAIDLSTNTTVGNCGGNSGITFCPAQNLYVVHTSGAMSVSNAAKWKLADLTSAGRVPLPHDSMFIGSLTGASTITCDVPRLGSIDLSGATQLVTWTLGNALACYGNYVLGNNIIPSGNYIVTLAGRGNFNLNTFGKNTYSFKVDCNDGYYTNLSNLNLSQSTGIIDLFSGGFDFNDYDAIGAYAFYNSGAKGLIRLGNGTLTFTVASAGNILYIGLATLLYSEGSTIKLSPASGSNNNIFTGNGKTFNIVHFSGNHTGTIDITGSNTFNNIKIDAGRKVRGADNSTQTLLTPLDAAGTPSAPITISGVTAAGFTLNYTGSKWIQCDWLTLTNVRVTPINRWFAGKNSVDNGGNTNWLFKRYILTPIINILRKL